MDGRMEDRELAETMLILAGSGAHDAAMQFAADCRTLGNEVSAVLWERVAASIDMIARATKPLVAAVARAKPETDSEWGTSARRIVHVPYDAVATWPGTRGDVATEEPAGAASD